MFSSSMERNKMEFDPYFDVFLILVVDKYAFVQSNYIFEFHNP